MTADQTEVARRKDIALSAIRAALASEEDGEAVRLFVDHHLEEIEATYWSAQLATDKPQPERVLGLLVLKSHWSEDNDNGLDTFDFTLPDDTTDYVLSVSFDDDGQVIGIEMES